MTKLRTRTSRSRGPSIRDVAREAGVSPGTASRVLSGSSYPVSDEARERVLRASTALGYVPNFAARALATGRSSAIAAIVHDITDPYFGEVVRGIEDAAARVHGSVLIASDDRHPRNLVERLAMLLGQDAAGVVLVGGQVLDHPTAPQISKQLERLHERGTPVVAVGRYGFDIPYVTVDELGAARLAVRHLLQQGHRRVAFLGGPMSSTTVHDRYRGFATALEEAGASVDEELVLETALTREGGLEGVHGLVASGHDFTAILAVNDEVAFGAMAGLRTLHIGVPGDVSVVGVNNVGMCEFVEPPLTSVQVPMRELGQTAWRMVDALRRNQAIDRSRILDATLVVRGSTAPVES
jgi:LacI family transcriptional regulator